MGGSPAAGPGAPGKTPVGLGAVVGWLGFGGGRKSMLSSKGALGVGLGFPDGDAIWLCEEAGRVVWICGGEERKWRRSTGREVRQRETEDEDEDEEL